MGESEGEQISLINAIFCSPSAGGNGNMNQSNEKNRNGRLGDENDDEGGSSKDVGGFIFYS